MAVLASLLLCSPSTSVADENTAEPVYGNILGLPSSMIRGQMIEVDFRTLTNPELTDEVVTLETIYNLELREDTLLRDLVVLTQDSKDISHLRLDSSNLKFRSAAIEPDQIESDWNLRLRPTVPMVANVFSASVVAGKHQLSVGLRVRPTLNQASRFQIDFRAAETDARTPVQLRVNAPEQWQVQSSWTGEKSFSSLDESWTAVPQSSLRVESQQVKVWNLATNFVATDRAYEFDRRFSITGWIALAVVALVSSIACISQWQTQQNAWFTCSSLLCCITAIGGLLAGFALPSDTNQMRTLRQQDHDQLLMMTNRLMRYRLESLQADRDVSDQAADDVAIDLPAEDSNLLTALSRQAAIYGKGALYSVNELPMDREQSRNANPQAIECVLMLSDSPASIIAVEINAPNSTSFENSAVALIGLHVAPIPTKVELDRPLSQQDMTPNIQATDLMSTD